MLAVHEYVAEDVQEGRWWVVCRPLSGGRQAAPTAVALDVEVQAVRGHPRASVGVPLSPRGVDEPQAGVPRAGGVEKVDQSVAPPGVVGSLLFAATLLYNITVSGPGVTSGIQNGRGIACYPQG